MLPSPDTLLYTYIVYAVVLMPFLHLIDAAYAHSLVALLEVRILFLRFPECLFSFSPFYVCARPLSLTQAFLLPLSARLLCLAIYVYFLCVASARGQAVTLLASQRYDTMLVLPCVPTHLLSCFLLVHHVFVVSSVRVCWLRGNGGALAPTLSRTTWVTFTSERIQVFFSQR